MHVHFDCFSGAAGDMILAAALDAADDSEALKDHVKECLKKGLPEIANDFDLCISKVHRGKMASIAALKVTVESRYNHMPAPVLVPSTETTSNEEYNKHEHEHKHDSGHDHQHQEQQMKDHNHNHSHSHSHDENQIQQSSDRHSISLNHSHAHNHAHAHAHHHNHGNVVDEDANENDNSQKAVKKSGPLRNLPQIRSMLRKASPDFIHPWVQQKAIDVFTELAHAEAQTHGAVDSDSVHFHEVGAIDSIVDTVGSLIALHHLVGGDGDGDGDGNDITFSCSRLPMGEGTCFGMHGLMPVPAPATLRLLCNMPTCPGPPGVTGELVTPTGASILRVLVLKTNNNNNNNNNNQSSRTNIIPGRPPNFTLRTIGIGAGTKDFERHPNIIRLLIGDSVVRKGGE